MLRCIYRSLQPDAGLISIDGGDVTQMTIRDSARKTAVVLQETPSEFDFQVEEIVFMGRTPHKGLLDRETDEDRRIVAESLERVGMTEFAGRNFWTLSGGEKQRVIVARALAQQTRFLVLDEPTNHLDIRVSDWNTRSRKGSPRHYFGGFARLESGGQLLRPNLRYFRRRNRGVGRSGGSAAA